MDGEVCGHYLPRKKTYCVRKLGHKSDHRDAEAEARQKQHYRNHEQKPERKEYRRYYLAAARQRDPERYREYEQRRVRDPIKRKRYSKNYYQRNQENILERRKLWRAENPARTAQWEKNRSPLQRKVRQDERNRVRRARLRNTVSVPWTREQVTALYGSRCYLCDSGPYEHTEHVIPLSRGGWDVLPNLRPSCAACNTSKHDSMPPLRDLLTVLHTTKLYLAFRCGTLLAGLDRSGAL